MERLLPASDDAKLFVQVWLGGLVFFTAFLA
jgi:hypothetical protein